MWIIISFIIIWCIGFYLHEHCHGLGCLIQDSPYTVEFKWYNKKPSLYMWCDCRVKHHWIVDYMGGMLCGLILLLLSVAFQRLEVYCISAPLFIVGLVNFVYGIYEGIFIRKLEYDRYMLYHYYLYVIVGLIALGLCLPEVRI